jgi:hypothetical protein
MRWTWLLALIAFRIFVDITATHTKHETAGAAIWAPYSTPGSDLNNASLCHLSNNDLLSIWKINDER